MAGNRHNECNSGIISTLKTYHTISLFQFSLILLLAYICAVLFIVMGMHMVFRSDHSGQRTQPDCLNVLHVCKPALACYTVTSGRTDPESWPRVESTDLLKPCQAEGMRWFLHVCVCVPWDWNVKWSGFAGSVHPGWDQNHLKLVWMRSPRRVMEWKGQVGGLWEMFVPVSLTHTITHMDLKGSWISLVFFWWLWWSLSIMTYNIWTLLGRNTQPWSKFCLRTQLQGH